MEPDEKTKNAEFIVFGLLSNKRIVIIDLRDETGIDKQFAVMPISEAFSAQEMLFLYGTTLNDERVIEIINRRIGAAASQHLGVVDLKHNRTVINITSFGFNSREIQRQWYKVGKVIETRGKDLERFGQITRELLFQNRLTDVN